MRMEIPMNILTSIGTCTGIARERIPTGFSCEGGGHED